MMREPMTTKKTENTAYCQGSARGDSEVAISSQPATAATTSQEIGAGCS